MKIVPTAGSSLMEIVVLPPAGALVPAAFRYVTTHSQTHRDLIEAVQRFRGAVYLEDGAVRPEELSPDGRHRLPIDHDSWHVVTLDKRGELCACLRFLEESAVSRFDGLWIRHAAITQSEEWGGSIRKAVENDIGYARRHRMRFGEVGGWAISAERRGTVEGLRSVLAMDALLQTLGGSIGLATATSRHGSAPILRRLGMESLAVDGHVVPPYFDPQYGCSMELLRYDSRYPNPKYANWIRELSACLLHSPVICHADGARRQPTSDWRLPLAACL